MIRVKVDPNHLIEEAFEENNGITIYRTLYLPGDFNQDGRVDIVDREFMVAALGDSSSIFDMVKSGAALPDPLSLVYSPVTSVDGVVDGNDLAMFDAFMDLDMTRMDVLRGIEQKEHDIDVVFLVPVPVVGAKELGQLTMAAYNGPPESGGVEVGRGVITPTRGGWGIAEVRVPKETIGSDSLIWFMADAENIKEESDETNNVVRVTIVPSRFIRLNIQPNPFNAWTWISLSTVGGGSPEIGVLYILNAWGQVVRQYEVGGPRGPVRVLWDGRDGQERPVASGVYIARIVAGRQRAAGSLLLVR